MIRVLIADDHAVVRQGLRTFLELQDGIEVVGEAADGEEALALAADDGAGRRARRPRDAAASTGSRRSGDCARLARRTRVIVLTSFLDDDKLLPAVRAGAAGYLLKDVQPQELVAAIRTVHDGNALLDPAVDRPAARGSSPTRAAQTPSC